MLSGFFIDRPIFAAVISILITLAGAIAGLNLPIAQYPPIAPPTVQVSCTYPGASAVVVADTVAAPIEQQVNGVENMLYMSSQCGNDGSYNLTITFDLATDLNTALVMVQNRVSLAMPQLPESVQKQGLTIKKKTPNILLVVNFYSPDGRYDDIYLSNYATINVKDELFRLPGVGDLTYLGQRDYSIRVWLDPQQLSSRNITANEVSQAIGEQSQSLSTGQLGEAPAVPGTVFQYPTDALGRLTTPEQFGDIVVKNGVSSSGAPQLVRLKDVARITLGAVNYDRSATLDGMPSVAIAVYQLPGTNALDVANQVRAKMEHLKKRFPAGVDYKIAYDTTPFIEESVRDVIKTLIEAIVLVAIVVLAFLQNWRATIIPLVAVPVAIVGTFAIMAALGLSLNNISLFGLVLAIGIVVDDAIVVVENVERWLHEGLPPREAAHKAMLEVTSPVIAVAVVLCAVFLPCAFITGITGQFFRQFAITIAASTVFSALNSLTLSPALAALLLRPRKHGRDAITGGLFVLSGIVVLPWLLNTLLGTDSWLLLGGAAAIGGVAGLGIYFIFNPAFDLLNRGYTWLVRWALRLCILGLIIYAGLIGVTGYLFTHWPVGFIPQQDQGWLMVNVQLPDSSSVQQTQAVMKRIEQIALKTEGVAHTCSVSGQSLLLTTNSSNFASMFVVLKPFRDRRSDKLGANGILATLKAEYAKAINNAQVSVFGAPAVPGIGVTSGFKLMVEDRGNLGLSALQKQTDRLVDELRKQKGLIFVLTQFRSNTPQLYMDIDRAKVRALGVDIRQVNQALQIFLGSFYVNNFNAFGRYWQVNVMAEGIFRNRIAELNQIQVRNSKGQMIPLGVLVDVRSIGGPVMVTRYNLYASAPINGVILPSLSSGEAIALIDGLAEKTLPRSMSTEWTDLTYMQIKAGNTAVYVFALAVVFVFLALAALYESWSLPLAVILVVPMCLLCSLVGVALTFHPIDIFVQIGFVVLVGLACKNAILIVEFARTLKEQGKPLFEGTVEACELRLRPILMTSFAFILGVVPLVVAHGAGWEMRRALGTAVFSGMLGVTLFGVFLTPIFFYVIEWLGERQLFSAGLFRWLGGLLLGPGLGVAFGLLLWKVLLDRWLKTPVTLRDLLDKLLTGQTLTIAELSAARLLAGFVVSGLALGLAVWFQVRRGRRQSSLASRQR